MSGKATITIDVNGKKVTREVDLGKSGPGTLTLMGNSEAPEKGKKPAEMRAWLGVATAEPSDEVRAQLPIPNGTGVLVLEVIADTPAAKAGLQKNDILARLDDQILTNAEQLRALVGMKKEGDTVHVTYLRKGQEAAAEIKLAQHAEELTFTGTTMLNNLIKTATSGSPLTAGPVVVEKSGKIDDAGNVSFTFHGEVGGKKDGVKPGEEWNLDRKGAQADVTAAIQQLEKTLRAAGASDEAIAKARQAVADAVGQLQKAVSGVGAPKDEVQRNVQKAIDELRRSIEEAWRPVEGAASKQR